MFFGLSLSAAALAQTNPSIIFALLDHLYVPYGFNEINTTEVVVTGYLPSPCYGAPEYKVRVNNDQVYIRMTTTRTQTADHRPNLCTDVAVPFTETLKIGRLNPGHYQVRINEGSARAIMSTLDIARAKVNSVDEYPYAIVQYVEQNQTDMHFYLNGYVYSDCYVLDQVRYMSNQKDVLAVLPIMKQIRPTCPRKMIPYRVRIDPPLNSIPSPVFLLHVRSADGHSVNFVGQKK